MRDAIVIWDEDNTAHVADNGLTPDEVDEVLLDPSIQMHSSSSSDRPVKFGWTSTGKHIIVIWEDVNDDPRMIYPVTAYEVPPRQRKKRK